MQQRDTAPPDEPSPEDGPGTQAKKPTSRRDALLGCGCLAVVAAAGITIALVVVNSGGHSSAASSTTPPSSAAASGPASSATLGTAAGVALTGFGAPFDTWNATRHPDGDVDPNTSYGADPALPQINGHTGARYVAVQGDSGYVVAYQVNFRPNTSITAALDDVLRHEFPSDAHYLWKRTVPGQCYQAEVKSPAVARALTGTQIGDGTGLVFLEAKTLPPGGTEGFDPADVTYASLGFQSYSSQAQAPGC
jgi:hypothetical protein